MGMKISGLALLVFQIILLLEQSSKCAAQQNSSPEAIAKMLRTGTAITRITLARKIGISDSDLANGLGQCQTQIDNQPLERPTETSILRVKCGHDLYLVLFGRNSGTQWRMFDSMSLYDAYDKATLQYLSLIRPSTKEIVVHNAATVSGNLYQAYFLIIRVVHGRFRTALALLETATEPHIGSSARDEKSTIAVQSATATQVGEIDQAAHLTIGSRSFQIQSSFAWNEMLRTFAKDSTDQVSQIN